MEPTLTGARYELIDVVASGGMATVWRARDVLLDRIVALKRPHPAPAGSPAIERFAREARTAATLSHPHLVTVFDVGADEHGPYIVMEFVDGPTLAEAQPGSIDVGRVGADVASALAALHAVGVVHRDVTPSNILLAHHGAMLTDFGIARSIDSTMLTQPGVVHATPAYAAPEVLRGEPSVPASDVYSLASVLSELATGQPLAASGTRAMPSDPRWRAALEPALSPRPEDRPSAEAFRASLPPDAADPTAALPVARSIDPGPTGPDGTTVLVATTATGTPTSRPRPRRRVWLSAAAIAALVVVAGLVAARAGDDPEAALAPASDPVSTSSLATPAGTVDLVVPEPAPGPATVQSTGPATVPVAADESGAGAAARDRLVAYIQSLVGEEISDGEATPVIDGVDDAVIAAEAGDLKRAERQLRDVDKRLAKALESDAALVDASAMVDDLSRALGITDDD